MQKFILDQNYFKRHQVIDKSKIKLLDEFSKREAVVIEKIFLQLKSDILLKLDTLLPYITFNNFISNSGSDIVDADLESFKKVVSYYSFLRIIWREFLEENVSVKFQQKLS